MSNKLEHNERMRRFKKAQEILDTPDEEFSNKLESSEDLKADPRLLEDYANHLDRLVESSELDSMKYLDYFRFKAEINNNKADEVIEYLSYGEPNFKEYDISTYDFGDRIHYIGLTGEFLEWRNRYTIIEAFTNLVKAKIAPPAWMLEAVAQGFAEHLRDPDPKKLAKQLGLQGGASGKSNPYKEYCRLSERRTVVVEMLILIVEFGISQKNAASAVKIKHNLKAATKTLCNDYRKYTKERTDVISQVDYSLKPLERQKFIERFPVSARKFLKKKTPTIK